MNRKELKAIIGDEGLVDAVVAFSPSTTDRHRGTASAVEPPLQCDLNVTVGRRERTERYAGLGPEPGRLTRARRVDRRVAAPLRQATPQRD